MNKKTYILPHIESYSIKWESHLLSVSPGNMNTGGGEVSGDDIDAKIFDFDENYKDDNNNRSFRDYLWKINSYNAFNH